MIKWSLLVVAISIIAGFSLFLFLNFYIADASVSITATVTACGTPQEECSGLNLNGETCQSQGFDGGTLSCAALCIFNTSQCFNTPSGGGGGAATPKPATVTFDGLAYPNSEITILKSGEIIGAVNADYSGHFNKTFFDVTSGTYVFGFWGKDVSGRSSITFAFPVQLLPGAVTSIKNITLPPTIAISKRELLPEENLMISGSALAESEVTIFITKAAADFSRKIKITANPQGEWSYVLQVNSLGFGSFNIRAQSSLVLQNMTSPLSQALSFNIAEEISEEEEELKPFCVVADLNCDGRVDIVDFSILLYWWNKKPVEPLSDLNNDTVVDVADFSILMYYWTG